MNKSYHTLYRFDKYEVQTKPGTTIDEIKPVIEEKLGYSVEIKEMINCDSRRMFYSIERIQNAT